jgi:hypothetical protein
VPDLSPDKTILQEALRKKSGGPPPVRIRVDNGTECTSKALDWAYHRSLQWHPPARVPIATLVSQSREHAANPYRVARELQQASPAQQFSGHAAGSIPSGWLLRPTPQPASKRAWVVDQDRGELSAMLTPHSPPDQICRGRFRTVDIWKAA